MESTPNVPIVFRATWKVRAGKLADAKKAAEDFVKAINQSQPGTRSAAVYLSNDEKLLFVHEIHKDVAAVRAHLGGTTAPAFMPRFAAAMEGPDFEVLGALPDDVMKMLVPFKPKVSKPVAAYFR
jgi:quinol monooxygenase YgiN